MIRLIGILTGSAIAVSFLIVVVGIPEFAAHEPLPDRDAERVAVAQLSPDRLPERQAEPEPATFAEPEPSMPAESDPTSPAEQQHEVQADPETTAITGTPSTVAPEPMIPIAETAPEPIEIQWYAFWSPFRSKIAADGFVSELQRTTGLDYRVVKLKPGVYEVAFAYSDDTDIQDKLTQISSATGLDLSGG